MRWDRCRHCRLDVMGDCRLDVMGTLKEERESDEWTEYSGCSDVVYAVLGPIMALVNPILL